MWDVSYNFLTRVITLITSSPCCYLFYTALAIQIVYLFNKMIRVSR